ncbi:MAG: HEAT repeat domain-containing protein [Bdellovibrionales bacterium]|nr:HEAT repeat domain-containing protein [Bdellovibrionales bacterium]
MKIRVAFSKKQKLLLWFTIPLAMLVYHWVSVSQEVDRLVARLERGAPEQRIEAAYALAQMGSSAGGAVDALGSAIRDPDAQIRAAATAALVQISRRDAIKALSDAFDDRNTAVRLDAAEALDRIGSPKAREILAQSEAHSARSYERARMSGWVDQVRRELRQQEKERYRRHRKMYDRQPGR